VDNIWCGLHATRVFTKSVYYGVVELVMFLVIGVNDYMRQSIGLIKSEPPSATKVSSGQLMVELTKQLVLYLW
jgi:hypothetical protein